MFNRLSNVDSTSQLLLVLEKGLKNESGFVSEAELHLNNMPSVPESGPEAQRLSESVIVSNLVTFSTLKVLECEYVFMRIIRSDLAKNTPAY